ncbi:MAG: hypothetical protein A2168_09280 [Planctomycetes bacterium RBG_13_50_24]|nr:MAG: hypothetical protein A2168_09280 [Planctomycetes bacterium RBG_13_50_24]
MSSAKLKLGIYYFRKSASRFSEDNWVLCHKLFLDQMLRILFLERKNQKRRFFLSKSMPNFNFTEALGSNWKGASQ